MPMRAPRLCRCGNRVAIGARCPCEQRRDAERKARFDATRPSSSATGYDRSWSRARAEYLREHRHCRRCGRLAAVVDHIVPHKGNAGLFWDRANWQAICTPCHSGAKQREERRTKREAIDMTAFAAGECRVFIGAPVLGETDLDGEDWTEVARVETIGTTRIAGGVEITVRCDDIDVGQGTLRAASASRVTRAFRVVFADGSERRFAARVVSARERDARLRAVLAVSSSVRRLAPEMVLQ